MDENQVNRGVETFMANVRLIADHEPSINIKRGRTIVSLTITPDERDFAKLIGGQGAIHMALAALAGLIGHRNGFEFIYNSLHEPEQARGSRAIPNSVKGAFLPRPDWNQAKIEATLRQTADHIFGPSVIDEMHLQEVSKSIYEILVPKGQSNNAIMVAGQTALNRLYDAIGRKHGRKIQICVVDAPAEREQPLAADGRFARMKRPR